MQSLSPQQGTNMHHTYDYADPDVCLQHTNIALKQPRNREKGHPSLTSKQGEVDHTQAHYKIFWQGYFVSNNIYTKYKFAFRICVS